MYRIEQNVGNVQPSALPYDITQPTKITAFHENLSKPTAATHALFCNVLSSTEKHLCVVFGHLVEFFRVVETASGSKFESILCEFMPDEVYDIAAVRLNPCPTESLLLTFREAKLAAVSYDPHLFELKALSLHNYEFDNLKCGATSFVHGPMLRVDPGNSCAIMLVYDRNIAVLPFRRTDALMAEDNAEQADVQHFPLTKHHNSPILPTYTLPLENSTSEKILHVRDMQFLPGFFEPTLLILYEPVGTWSGRIAARKDTCCAVALSLNLQKRTNPVIWFQENLPFDCFKIFPMSQVFGGALIIATNSILYVKQNNPCFGIALNGYARITTNFPLKFGPPECGALTMDGCSALALDHSNVLLATHNGDAYVLSLWQDQATKNITCMLINHCCKLVPASCLAKLDRDRIFMGSKTHDSLLLRQLINTVRLNQEGRTEAQESQEEGDSGPDDGGVAEKDEFDATDVELYGDTVRQEVSAYRDFVCYSFAVTDQLRHLGPISKLSAGEVPCLAQGNTDPADDSLLYAQVQLHNVEALACVYRDCAGVGPHGGPGVAFAHLTVRPRCLSAFELPEYDCLWSLYGPPLPPGGPAVETEEAKGGGGGEEEAENPSESGERQEHETKEEEAEEGTAEAKPEMPKHSFLLLSSEDSTMVLETGKEIMELEVSGFNTSEPTVAALNLGQCYLRPLGERRPAGQEPVVGVDYPFVLQVSQYSLRLLDGPKLLECLPITQDWRLQSVAHADPYVLVRSEDDELFFFRLKSPDEIAQAPQSTGDGAMQSQYFDILPAKVGQVSALSCLALFRDEGGGLLAQSLYQSARHLHDRDPGCARAAHQSRDSADLHTHPEKDIPLIDREDILIYGRVIQPPVTEASKSHSTPTKKRRKSASEAAEAERNAAEEESGAPTAAAASRLQTPYQGPSEAEMSGRYFAFIAFSNGVLEIYSLPSFTILAEIHDFADLPFVMGDHRAMVRGLAPAPLNNASETAGASSHADLLRSEEDMTPPIQEILLCRGGWNGDRTYLCARTQQEVAVYEALTFGPTPACSVPLKWRRMGLPCLLQPPKRISQHPSSAGLIERLRHRDTLMTAFEGLSGGHRGVFVAGTQPLWLFFAAQGYVRVLPHAIDGVVFSFAPLHATACEAGFVYLTHANEMRLATLPPGYCYSDPIAHKWAPTRAKVHFIQYHLDSKTYALITSKVVQTSSVYRLTNDGTKSEEELPRPETCVLPERDQYRFELYSAERCIERDDLPWELVPNTTFEFDDWEVVVDQVTARLRSVQNAAGTRDYVAMCANLAYGEEIPVRGRILIFDIVAVVPEPGRPLTAHKLKKLCDEEQKGAVTALTSCNGFLLGAVGQKVYIWQFGDGNKLTGMAFIDTDIYLHQMLCVKNLVVGADLMKSVHVLRYQPKFRVLSLVAKEACTRDIHTVNFFIDGEKLAFISTDEWGNIVINGYDPFDPSSRNGRRLVRLADFRMPVRVTACLRLSNMANHALLLARRSSGVAPAVLPKGTRGRVRDELDSEGDRSRHSVYMWSQYGSLLRVTPVREKLFARLRITERNLMQFFGPKAGLHSRMTRQYRRPELELEHSMGQIADGDLLRRFLCLSHSQRVEIAKKSGQNWRTILDDFSEIYSSTLHF